MYSILYWCFFLFRVRGSYLVLHYILYSGNCMRIRRYSNSLLINFFQIGYYYTMKQVFRKSHLDDKIKITVTTVTLYVYMGKTRVGWLKINNIYRQRCSVMTQECWVRHTMKANAEITFPRKGDEVTCHRVVPGMDWNTWSSRQCLTCCSGHARACYHAIHPLQSCCHADLACSTATHSYFHCEARVHNWYDSRSSSVMARKVTSTFCSRKMLYHLVGLSGWVWRQSLLTSL